MEPIEQGQTCADGEVSNTAVNTEVVSSSSTNHNEVQRRYIDGKWYCEDGCGGYLVYENEKWTPAEEVSIKQKWDKAGSFNANEVDQSQRCTIDGVVHEWNEAAHQWLPVVEVNEDFLAVYNANYGIDYSFGNAEGTSSFESRVDEKKAEEQQQPKKAKLNRDKKREKNEGWVEFDESKNSAVYVSNLPTSITEESFAELMSKCGVIQMDPRTNKLKIKLYKDENGCLKGDGTCGYIKMESVDLALKILDGWNIGGKRIHVEKAKYQMKGEFDPSKKRKKLTAAQKKRFIEKQQKIFEWKPEKPRNYRPVSDCTIVMKNMFTLDEMMKNAALVLDLGDEIRKVCERFGKVKKVYVYDNNPEGVVSVTFENVEHSDSAVKSLNGRVVDGRVINVSIWDGKTKYKVDETEEQKRARIAQWQSHIGEGNDGDDKTE
uniref:17S U2 SnRNP complex component HTATSF1 n=1 Tax=Syphacia muris TaxID=451379 RepID=A0A0N5AA01_9BILA